MKPVRVNFLRISVFLILLPLCLEVAGQTSKISALNRKYPPAELREDATIFANVVLAMHPAVGIYQPREYYQQIFTAFIDSLNDSLTERNFRIQLKLIADELHCGHTEVLYSQAYYKEIKKQQLNYSPYFFMPLYGKVFMYRKITGKPDSLINPGAEIRSINGIPADSMIRFSRRFISSDGYNETSRDHYLQLGFNSYYTALFGRPDTFSVTFKHRDSLHTVKYPAFKPKKIPAIQIGPRNDSLLRKFKRAGIAYRFLDTSEKTMYMRIAKFSTTGENRAYRRIFRKMHRKKSENLVIDLRGNGGGSLLNTYRLLSYVMDKPASQTLRTSVRRYPYKRYTRGNIWFRFTRLVYGIAGRKTSDNGTDNYTYIIKPRKKHHFNGKMFVLINGGSFSASSLVAAYVKSTGRAVFIGQESGGAIEGCNAGVTPYYKLPNTKLRVRIPAFRIVHDVSPQITGKGVMPDYEIRYRFSDIVQRKDLELAKVKELLNIE